MYFSNCMHKLNKMLLVALAAMGFASAKAQTTLPGSIQEAVKENVSAKAVMENIITRTSVRKFKQQPVEDVKIEALLRAGMAAPTANDMQPWHFVVLKDKQDIEKYAESNKNHKRISRRHRSSSLSAPIPPACQKDRARNFGYRIFPPFPKTFSWQLMPWIWEPAGLPSILSRRR